MANVSKTWFLAPTWGLPPAAVRLGYIITNPLEPRYPINPKDKPAEATDDTSSGSLGSAVFVSNTPSFKMDLSDDKATSLGLWGQFLQVVGLSAEAKLTLSKGQKTTYAFESTHTEWFNPSLKAVQTILGEESVQEFLDVAGLRKPLYLITGVKTVKGASLSTSQTQGHAYAGKFGVDGTPAGAPMSAGPELEKSRSRSSVVECTNEGPIVFAYQLTQVTLKKDKTATKPYLKGAMFEAGGSQDDENVLVELEDDFFDAEAQSKKLKGRGKNLQALESLEEGTDQTCTVVVTKPIA